MCVCVCVCACVCVCVLRVCVRVLFLTLGISGWQNADETSPNSYDHVI